MLGLDNPIHLAFLLVLLLLVFGAKRLPEMGRSLGAGMRGFKDSLSGEHTSEHAEHSELEAGAEGVHAQRTAMPVPTAMSAPDGASPAVATKQPATPVGAGASAATEPGA